MVIQETVSLHFHPLKVENSFFSHGRPAVEPPGVGVFFRRPFDFLILIFILIGILTFIIHLVLLLNSLPPLPDPSPNASLTCAIYSGKWSGPYTVLRFYGVPYAIPPMAVIDLQFEDFFSDIKGKQSNYDHSKHHTNVLRWQPPWPINGIESCILSHHDRCTFKKSQWSCNLDKPNTISYCAQPVPKKADDFSQKNRLLKQERCLQLDIALPSYEGNLRPVIVVLSGFQFITEPLMPPAFTYPAYWPTNDVVLETNAVWVYVHYRLGLAGFFYDFNFIQNSSSTKNTHDIPFHNFALDDQLLALDWINKNIARFGGDRNRITLLGHGSGATSALALLLLQSKRNRTPTLFRQAWLSSGSVHWSTIVESGPSSSIPLQILIDFVKRYLGAHCIDSGNKVLRSCDIRRMHRALNKDSIPFLYASIRNILNDSALLGNILDYNSPGKSWIYNDDGSSLPPPNNWTNEQIRNSFIYNSEMLQHGCQFNGIQLSTLQDSDARLAICEGIQWNKWLSRISILN